MSEFIRTPIYISWGSMRQRCLYRAGPDWDRYGGRGITICKEWSSFRCFEAWAKQSGHKTGLTLDRIDNDGYYSPENCKWSTRKEQANNRLMPRGETHCKSKFSNEDVLAIRADPSFYRIIADKYGVSKSAIAHIKSRYTWKHI